MAALVFSPPATVSFDITGDAAGAPGLGSAEGSLTVTNVVAAPDAAVLLKVKTNAAERYLVHPHILLLAPGETRVITSELRRPHAQRARRLAAGHGGWRRRRRGARLAARSS